MWIYSHFNEYLQLTGIKVNNLHCHLNLSFFIELTTLDVYVVSAAPDGTRSILIETGLNKNDMGHGMLRAFMLADCDAILYWGLDNSHPDIFSLQDLCRYLSCLVKARGCSNRDAVQSMFHITPRVLGH